MLFVTLSTRAATSRSVVPRRWENRACWKLFADRLGRESQLIVLRSNRVVPRGWLAFGAALGFDGVARDLLLDVAADGGAFLFIDGLGGFSEEEQLTVKDLVAEASQIAHKEGHRKLSGFRILEVVCHLYARRCARDAGSGWLTPNRLRFELPQARCTDRLED